MTSRTLWFPCMLLPFLFAVGLSFLAAGVSRQSVEFAASFGLVAIPCGLVGMSGSLIVGQIRGYENRIRELEQRLDASLSASDATSTPREKN